MHIDNNQSVSQVTPEKITENLSSKTPIKILSQLSDKYSQLDEEKRVFEIVNDHKSGLISLENVERMLTFESNDVAHLVKNLLKINTSNFDREKSYLSQEKMGYTTSTPDRINFQENNKETPIPELSYIPEEKQNDTILSNDTTLIA